MNAYIFFVERGLFPDNYHEGGGGIIIAGTEELARDYLKKYVENRTLTNLTIRQIDLAESQVYAFPDTGCCY